MALTVLENGKLETIVGLFFFSVKVNNHPKTM